MKVLVIPEDPRLDQYILKPVVERIFVDLGRSPRVNVLANPRLRGVAEALDQRVLGEVVANYPMHDLFLVIVDRDGDTARTAAATARVEVWMLALHRDAWPVKWREIRREIRPKERFAVPLLRQRAPKLDPGQGRAWAMQELGEQWNGVLRRCPEIAELRRRVENWLEPAG